MLLPPPAPVSLFSSAAAYRTPTVTQNHRRRMPVATGIRGVRGALRSHSVRERAGYRERPQKPEHLVTGMLGVAVGQLTREQQESQRSSKIESEHPKHIYGRRKKACKRESRGRTSSEAYLLMLSDRSKEMVLLKC